MLQSDLLASIDGINHGFFTREGGVSGGLYDSLNCGFGSGDTRVNVAKNRNRVAERLGVAPDRLITPRQSHSATAIIAERPWQIGDSPAADAIVTSKKGLAIGVFAADCAPILFIDPEAGVIAAAHSGWRGALGGILQATISKMEELGARPSQIIAAIGPALSRSAYEVGVEFRDTFVGARPENARFFGSGPSKKPYFDLAGYIGAQLCDSGVAKTETLGQCTYESESLFFSYRRSVHRREEDYGRQISAIALK
ncbi:MAG: peptidoglycan editing factor PgeF [Methyloligellaceae bacterium]